MAPPGSFVAAFTKKKQSLAQAGTFKLAADFGPGENYSDYSVSVDQYVGYSVIIEQSERCPNDKNSTRKGNFAAKRILYFFSLLEKTRSGQALPTRP